MSAHSFIELNGRRILGCRETYLPELAALFTETDARHEGQQFGYICSVSSMRDRLQLQGFTSERAHTDFAEAVIAWHERHANPYADELGVASRGLDDLSSELRAYLNGSNRIIAYQEPEEVFNAMDYRSALRVAVDLVEDDHASVRLDLDSLMDYGLISPTSAIAQEARDQHRKRVATDAALVVLTEGSTDSRLLAEGMRVTHPHLVGFVNFMDFSVGAEGSAANLAKLIRSFIGASIANRVVAVADNDTAAHDALNKLEREGLPDGYRVIYYPDIPLLSNYPTLGPQSDGPVKMNVNGTAGSIEMYLGRELLTLDGELIPVQWTGYIEGQRSYQGQIANGQKSRIHQAFRAKVGSALRDRNIRQGQDWSGVEAIIKAIIRAF